MDQYARWPNARYLDTLQRSEDEYAALKDQIKAAKAATKKVPWKIAPIHVLTDCCFPLKQNATHGRPDVSYLLNRG